MFATSGSAVASHNRRPVSALDHGSVEPMLEESTRRVEPLAKDLPLLSVGRSQNSFERDECPEQL